MRDLFETAGVKLSCVLSDLMGVTGRGIIEALLAGETLPDKLSWNVRGSLRKKEKQVKGITPKGVSTSFIGMC